MAVLSILSARPVLTCVLSLIVAYVVKLLINFNASVKRAKSHIAFRTLIPPAITGTPTLPRMDGVSMGRNYPWKMKHSAYEEVGRDYYSVVSAWPTTQTSFHFADAKAIKEVATSRARFIKPDVAVKVLEVFGANLVQAEGAPWKKHRKIVAPAFSDRNNEFVWDETVKIMLDLFNNVWGGQSQVECDNCVDLTFKIALYVISVAGFGKRVLWKDDATVPPGHQISFKEAVHYMSIDIYIKLLVPQWALGFNERTRRCRLAFDEIHQYMMEMKQDRLSPEKSEQRFDLFNCLLDANEHESDTAGARLDDSELIGNMFIFLLVGHETTAHALAFAMGLLALHQDEQETLYNSIKSVLADGRIPRYEDMPLLKYTKAVIYETTRMFPAVVAIPKESTEDTVVTTTDANGEPKTIPIAKGDSIFLDVCGLHYNPRFWEDPYTFKPSRFLGDWNHDAFMSFGTGHRACIGRKFSETEAVCVLTMLVMRYKLEVKEEAQFAGETFQERKARVLAVKDGISLTPSRIPVVFKLRA